jgi:hypothetical protein
MGHARDYPQSNIDWTSLAIWYRLYRREQPDEQSEEQSEKVVRPVSICVVTTPPRSPPDDIPFSRVEALYIAGMHKVWPTFADALITNNSKEAKLETKAPRQPTIFHLSAHGT